MTALQILDIKSFMNALLKSSLFDHFLLQEATITQAVSYTIDGTVNTDYFEPDELNPEEWKDKNYRGRTAEKYDEREKKARVL